MRLHLGKAPLVLSVVLALATAVAPAWAKTPRKPSSIVAPIQASAAAYKAILDDVRKQPTLELLRFKSVSLPEVGGVGKVELLDFDGKCTAIPYEVEFDAHGQNPRARVNPAALAECD